MLNLLCPIFLDFAPIFDKSKLLGVCLHSLHPQLLHHWILVTHFMLSQHPSESATIHHFPSAAESQQWKSFSKQRVIPEPKACCFTYTDERCDKRSALVRLPVPNNHIQQETLRTRAY